MTRRAWTAACFLAAAAPLAAQSTGAISGTVRDASSGRPLASALVTIEEGRRGAVTDATGSFRIREVRSGWHRVRAALIGYQPIVRDSVLVRAGGTIVLDLTLRPAAVEVESLIVHADVDPLLDPLATPTEQKVTAEEIRRLPISSLEEAIALSAGAVGESYRGGRLGQQSFILDGFGLKNQLDASTGDLGLRIPPDILTEASLVTNAFSARYGQALSGMINVVTRDGGDIWHGRAAYETDRPLGESGDYGLDRIILQGDGPLFAGVRFVGVVDAAGRLDADPVSAPRPSDELDPRSEGAAILPHNSGERLDLAAKLTIPLGARQTVRLFGLRSVEQRLLYDQQYKYDVSFAPAQRLSGTLLTGHLQHASSPTARLPLVADLRLGWYEKEFTRGELENEPDYRFGAFTGSTYRIKGEDLARAQDTVTTAGAVPGFDLPSASEATPWGVPAFFFAGGSAGEISWNTFEEFRTQLDATLGIGRQTDLYIGGEYLAQDVHTFQRVDAYLPSGGDVPVPTASTFSPVSGALYGEAQTRFSELAVTGGLRYDYFDPGSDLDQNNLGQRGILSPRIAVSTVLSGATFVASYGQFSQAPDLQYLVDASFDDSTRTGRFRRGNPNLGFEKAWQFEFSLRLRPHKDLGVKAGVYTKRMEGMVASVPLGVDPDSSIFGNADFGNVKGFELLAERPLQNGWGLRVAYTLQKATASSTSAYLTTRVPHVDPITGDTTFPAAVDYPLDFDRRHTFTAIFQSQVSEHAGVFAGLEGAAILHFGTGLPYSRTNAAGDSLVGLPNDYRLPSQSTLDLLIRKPFPLGRIGAGVYLDVRNVFNRSNIVAVRRDTGEPELDEASILLATQAAFEAHPEPIPFESPRYRAYGDLDGNGVIEGAGELLPLYERAARDYNQPVFAYGQPRLVRLGMELLF